MGLQVWRVIRAVAVAKFSLADQLLLIEFWVAFVIPFFDIGAAVSVSELLAEVCRHSSCAAISPLIDPFSVEFVSASHPRAHICHSSIHPPISQIDTLTAQIEDARQAAAQHAALLQFQQAQLQLANAASAAASAASADEGASSASASIANARAKRSSTAAASSSSSGSSKTATGANHGKAESEEEMDDEAAAAAAVVETAAKSKATKERERREREKRAKEVRGFHIFN